MKLSTKYLWFIFDFVLFLVINITCLLLLKDKFLEVRVSWLTLVIFAFAIYRTANIISNETVTKPLRAPFVNEQEKNGKLIEVPKKTGFTGAMGSLLYCPSCMGTWIAMVFVYAYVLWPVQAEIVAFILALSGMERLIGAVVGYLKNI